jgi:hypothetical protein
MNNNMTFIGRAIRLFDPLTETGLLFNVTVAKFSCPPSVDKKAWDE